MKSVKHYICTNIEKNWIFVLTTKIIEYLYLQRKKLNICTNNENNWIFVVTKKYHCDCICEKSFNKFSFWKGFWTQYLTSTKSKIENICTNNKHNWIFWSFQSFENKILANKKYFCVLINLCVIKVIWTKKKKWWML